MPEDLVELSIDFARAMRELRDAFLASPDERRPFTALAPASLRGAFPGRGREWADRARIAAAPYRAALAGASIEALNGGGAVIAFWVNAYNALASLSVAELCVRDRIERQPDFPYRTVLVAGGFRWSLEDIEQGVLRGNRPSPLWPFRPFGRRDGRAALALREPDFRIHFALDKCAASSPAFRIYSAAGIDEELAAAEAAFTSEGFRADRAARTIACDRLFGRARRDFPGRWLDDPAYAGWKKRYLPYDGHVVPSRRGAPERSNATSR